MGGWMKFSTRTKKVKTADGNVPAAGAQLLQPTGHGLPQA
jgi:hypothetical protein